MSVSPQGVSVKDEGSRSNQQANTWPKFKSNRDGTPGVSLQIGRQHDEVQLRCGSSV
jgi:hypothetical protein